MIQDEVSESGLFQAMQTMIRLAAERSFVERVEDWAGA